MMTDEPARDRISFPGLNGIRFIATLSVIAIHIEQFKPGLGIQAKGQDFALSLDFLRSGDAVRLFFVLSGFSIPYLLLVESRKTGTITVPQFWVRRILRSWPLCYLIMGLAFWVIPGFVELVGWKGYFEPLEPGGNEKLAIFALFLCNACLFWTFGASHLWSIASEGLFDPLWPILLRLFSKHVLWVLLAVIGFEAAVWGVHAVFFEDSMNRWVLIRYMGVFQIEAMTVGGLGAFVLFHRKLGWLSFACHPITQVLTIVFLLVHRHIFEDIRFFPFVIFSSVLYLTFILNALANQKPYRVLENRPLSYIGNISYGQYMYHPAVIYVVLLSLASLGVSLENMLVPNLFLYALAVDGTVAVAGLSHRFFEVPFLLIKQRFALISSGATLGST